MTAAYDAVLFDLDGILTSTAALHPGRWKRVFDEAPVSCPQHDELPRAA